MSDKLKLENEEQYDIAIKLLLKFMDTEENIEDRILFSALVNIIGDYEEIHYPIPSPHKDETEYLLSSKANAELLQEAKEQLDRGEGTTIDITDGVDLSQFVESE